MPHAYEAPRDDVAQETASEFRSGHRLGFALAAAGSVLVREGDVVVAMLEQPLVRDGDAVGVATEVAQDLLRPRHRGFAVDDEILRGGLTQPRAHRILRGTGGKAVLEGLEKLPPNTARAFMMREVLELETDEICKELAITANNLWVMLYRARMALRHCLEQNWFAGKSSRG